MSNVLIGIIGVILFIGLALAGALFLGPRFQEATLNSKAAAVMGTVSQVASAYELSYASSPVATTIGDLLARGYLKGSSVVNPAQANAGVGLGDDTGNYLPSVPTIVHADFGWDANDGGDYPGNAKLCAAIARQSGQTLQANGAAPEQNTLPTTASGCFLASGWGSVGHQYVAFRRL